MKQSGSSTILSRGIIINGAAGTGKTTLGGELAKRLNFRHMDLDDYYYSRESEFAGLRPHDEIRSLLLADLEKHPRFVMSGTIGSILWDTVNPLFDLAVLLFVPTHIRLERIKARAYQRFGDRALEGGDLYENHKAFYDNTVKYDIGFHSVSLERHEKWATEICCPVLRTDGTKRISENVALIAEAYLSIVG